MKTSLFLPFFLLLCLIPLKQSAAEETTPLKLVLRADKATYIKREPIRLLAFAAAGTPLGLSIGYNAQQESPASFDYYQVLADGHLARLGSNQPQKPYLDFVPTYDTWTTDASRPDLFWVENRFEKGTVKFRVIFHPLTGPLAKQQFVSNEVEVAVEEPQGEDKAAYAFLQNADGPHRNLRDDDFIYYSGSHHRRADHEYLVQEHGGSVYAYYARYLISLYYGYQDEDLYRGIIEQIVDGAPQDFPLRANFYVDLLSWYKEHGYLEKFSLLAEKVTREHVSSIDPQIMQQLNKAVEESATLWPPQTAEQKAVALEAALLVAAQDAARQSALTQALTAAYGQGRQPGTYEITVVHSRPTETKRHTWGMWFYDPRQSWAVTTKFFAADMNGGEKTECSGALESFCLGPLKESLEAVKQEQGLSSDEALKVFMQATIEQGVIRGMLLLGDKSKVAFTKTISREK